MSAHQEDLNAIDVAYQELDRSYLNAASSTELRKVLTYFDRESEPEKYAAVLDAMRAKPIPKIRYAEIGERIWTYFYEKYAVRIAAVLVFILAMATKSIPVLQPSRREYPDGFGTWFLIGLAVLFFWKGYQSWAASADNSWLKMRLGHATVMADGRRVGFLRAFVINLLKSYSMIVYVLIAASLCENYLAPETLAMIKPLVGAPSEGQPLGALGLPAVLLIVFWFADIIVLERTGRALHDRLTKTYVVALEGEVDAHQIAEFIRLTPVTPCRE